MNNSYQFFHIETYSNKPRKGSKRPSAEAVARECQRVEQSYPHIQKMQPAELLFGIEPLDALDKVRNIIKHCKDPLGRKIRSDAQIISFGVASIKVESTPENWELAEVKQWLLDTQMFLKKRFGDSFVSLKKHTDERFCHIHFCIIPKVNPDNSIDLDSLHPGLAAQRSVKSSSKSAKDHAYKEAMRKLQDEYFEHVGLPNGQLRFGPRRRRLTRKEWYSQRRYAALLSELYNKQTERINSLTEKLKIAKTKLYELIASRLSKTHSASAEFKELS